ncbi:DUF6183 family protein [Streptomyces sp. NPDC049040]|uniref:DUF6183 family protein n=1 Tax=Streptomyces sp. NPDC049040 TaxID=3365593 RepID=UPI003719F514
MADRTTLAGWARDGEAERIAEVVGPLVADRDRSREYARSVETHLSYVLKVLAVTPGRRFMEQLLRVYGGAGGESLLASMIASQQSFEDALYVLAQEPPTGRADVLGGCLYHELLLRGADPQVLRRANRRRMPTWLSPDLSWLPTEIREPERGLFFPSYSYDGGGSPGGADDMAAPAQIGPDVRRQGAAYRFRETASVDLRTALTEAPRKGDMLTFEGRAFTMERPIPHDALPGVLAALPLECLEGLEDDTRFEVSPSSLAEVWKLLYHSAASGGIGSEGLYGAYGRLAAWRSVCALSGADLHASFDRVEEQALACTWWRFETDAEWFCNDLSADYGIAALTPDGRRLAVVAATDTD